MNPRFTCPINPDHTDFFLRRSYSEAYDVSPEGVVADEENRNTLEGEGDSPVYCNGCWEANLAIVQATDAEHGTPLREAYEPQPHKETR